MGDTDTAGERAAHGGDGGGAALVDAALGFVFPAALRAAALARVADHLTEGPRAPAELAADTGTDPAALTRVLRLLATRGLFGEDEQGRFRLEAAGQALRSDVPGSVRDAILMLTDRTFWLPAGRMDHCLTTGESVFEAIFTQPFFDHFAQDAKTAAVFHDGMAAMSGVENGPIAHAYDFPRTGTVVDVGGGQGGFLAAVLRAGPGLDGVLYDRAHVLAGHRLGDDAALAGRWSTAEGDFFADVPKGDVLVLKRILHDWQDEQCVGLLRACRRALAPGGRVLVVDAVIAPDNRPHQAKDLDLLMMTSLVGRERTYEDFRALLAEAGLRLTRVVPTPTVLSVVEAQALDDATGTDGS
ncbi:methyltransferase [Streptomyces spectabilis]|uniref:SAM-dependent methyltransferase n=1 Tax=Streptomyces spectabilis TaxID=68270 RepID=A0A516RJQ7_STRST|nr:methyltransferase [Streptomyces spectabilis]QDQ15879.1 SAM-dependent methyltransferase [Streptomyces spectabilis]